MNDIYLVNTDDALGLLTKLKQIMVKFLQFFVRLQLEVI